jgi:hypothetical protein
MANGGLIFHTTAPDPNDIVQLGDRWVPRVLLAEVSSLPLGVKPTLRLRLEVVGDRPQCREVCYSSAQDGREIRQGDIDTLRIADWIEYLFAFASHRDVSELALDRLAAIPESMKVVAAARRGNGPRKVDRAFLEQVAGVYGRNLHDRPTQAVSDAFGIAHSTAAEYVRRARAAGLLPPTTPGKRRA